jgi:hypothetical protein
MIYKFELCSQFTFGIPKRSEEEQRTDRLCTSLLQGSYAAGVFGPSRIDYIATYPNPFPASSSSQSIQSARLFCPVVGIGSPHPLTRKRELLPFFESKGGI